MQDASERSRRSIARVSIALCLLFVLALGLRLLYLESTEIVNPMRADAREYAIYGHNLKAYGVFSKDFPSETPRPDSYRSPGFPALVALAMSVGGGPELLLYAHAVLGSLTVLLTFSLGRRMLSAWGAIAAAALVAVSPHLVAMTSYTLTETLFAFFLLSAVVCLCAALEGRRAAFALSGALFGCAYLTNETALPVPILCAAVVALAAPATTNAAALRRGLAVLVAAFALFPAAWTLRNAINVPEDAARGSLRAITTMSHGAYPDFVFRDPRLRFFPYDEDPEQPEFGSSLSGFVRVLVPRVAEQPGRYLRWYLFEKPVHFWSWSYLQGEDVYVYPVSTSLYQTSSLAAASRVAMRILHPVVMALAVLALPLWLWLRQAKPSAGPPVGPIPFVLVLVTIGAYYTLTAVVFAPWPRYSVPLRPELYATAIWTLERGIDQLRSKT